ncbi:MAG: iron-sulfur cluster insertion protein ErpA [Sphingomonadales bacterium]
MPTPASQKPSLLTISDSAVQRIAHLKEQEGDPALMLRVEVNGGGCSGFQYAFSFDQSQNPDDEVIEQDGITVLIDAMSVLYVAGSEIDFVNTLMGSSFRIQNPNATAQCSCGNSFAI